MHSLSASVLLFAGLATIWLIYYRRVVLPKEFEERCRQSMQAFSTAVEMRAPMQKGVAKRVARICRAIGSRRGIPESALIEMELAAHLRGIGLCGLPYSTLHKVGPSEWTSSEKKAYLKHPELSAGMVRLIPALRHLSALIDSGSKSGGLVVQESREILELASNYVWTERWEGIQAARYQLAHATPEMRDPQIGREMAAALASTRTFRKRD